MSRLRPLPLACLVLACQSGAPADASGDASATATADASTTATSTAGAADPTTTADTLAVDTAAAATTTADATSADTTSADPTTGEPLLCGEPLPCPGGVCTGLLRGASEGTVPRDLAVDPCGDILVTGSHHGIEPGLGLGAAAMGVTDAFVARVDRTGTPRWGRSFGEPDNVNEYDVDPSAVAVHPDGSIFVAGAGSSPFVVDGLACDGYATKAFVLKLTPDGEPVWLRCHEDPPVVHVADMVVHADALYLAGECHGQDFDDRHMFLARVDAVTGAMDASACLDSGGYASLRRIVRDGRRLVVLGDFRGILLFTQPLAAPDGDLVLARFDPAAWTPGAAPPWDFSAQYGGPGFVLADGLARADDGSLAGLGRGTPHLAGGDGGGPARGLGESDSRALFAVYTPSGAGYTRTTNLCFGRNLSNESFDVVARPGGGFSWTGYSYHEIFAPPHRLAPASPAMFVATWVDGAGITPAWMPGVDGGRSAYYTRLAVDPLGLVVAGAYHGDPQFFPGDDAPAVGQRLFVLQTAADLTFTP